MHIAHYNMQSAHVAKCWCCKVHMLQGTKNKVTSNSHYIFHFLSYTLNLIHCISQIASDKLYISLKPEFKNSLKIWFKKSFKLKKRNCTCYKLHVLQSAQVAKCTFCKVHMLQIAHVAKSTCWKLQVLQSVCVSQYTCCKVHILQSARILWKLSLRSLSTIN